MSNNTTKLKEELSSKGLCDENLLAWGQSDHVVAGAILGGAVGAAIGSAMARILRQP